MRLYNRQDFMKLPEGTIYTKGKPWAFEELSIKDETLKHDGENNDWWYLGTAWINADSSDDNEKFTRMLEGGASYPMSDAYGRDGCFDKDDIFLVYENADLEKLKGFIEKAMEIST